MVFQIKVQNVTSAGLPIGLSTVLLPIDPPVQQSEFNAAGVHKALAEANLIGADSVVNVYYKDTEGELVLIVNRNAPWPVDPGADGIIKAYFLSAPPPPAVNVTAVCMGPHTHQPSPKRAKTLTVPQFSGYSMIEAASAGCAPCVEFWLEHGVGANFSSINEGWTAMDFALWSEEQGTVTPSMASAVVSTLAAHGAQARAAQ